jgi:hypothetical protein
MRFVSGGGLAFTICPETRQPKGLQHRGVNFSWRSLLCNDQRIPYLHTQNNYRQVIKCSSHDGSSSVPWLAWSHLVGFLNWPATVPLGHMLKSDTSLDQLRLVEMTRRQLEPDRQPLVREAAR